MKRHPLSDRLRGITQEVVATYGVSGDPGHHLDPERRLPSRTVVVRILEDLVAVLYPGFYGAQHLTRENVEYHVGALLDDIAADLYTQTVQAFQFEHGGREEGFSKQAERAVESFLIRLPELRRLLLLDVQAAMDGDPAARSYAEIILSYPGFEAITTQRIAHELLDPPSAAPAPDHDRARPFADGDRHPSRGADRRVLLHRPRHGGGHRRDRRHRQERQDLPGGHAGRAVLREGRAAGSSCGTTSAIPRSATASWSTRARRSWVATP